MRRVFADANVLIAGADARGASQAVLRLAEVGLFRLVVSRQVLDEAEHSLRNHLPGALKLFFNLMAELNLEILPDPDPALWIPWVEVIESEDAPILAAPVEARVDRFITLNTADFTDAVAEKSGLLIQTPAEFIATLRDLVTGDL